MQYNERLVAHSRLLITRRNGLSAVLDAATRDVGDEARWARGICESSAIAMPEVLGVGVQHFEFDDAFRVHGARHEGVGVITSLREEDALRVAQDAPVEALRQLANARNAAVLLPPELTSTSADGVKYAAVVVSQPLAGQAVVLVLKLERRHAFSPHEQQLFSQLKLSLDAGADALRNRGVMGRWTADATPLDGTLANNALWSGVTSGRYRLQPIGTGPLRHVRVLENPAHQRASRRLSERETAVLELSARGITGKQQSWELGVSASMVSRLLMTATTRLGFVHPSDAIRFLGGLLHRPSLAAELTASEQDIFQLVREGLTNQEIADRRSRSVRTVANQVASVLRKTGAASRRALYPMSLEPHEIIEH